MKRDKPYFILYAHNQVVQGEKRAAVYDLKQARVFYIPNILVDILEDMQTQTVAAVIDIYAADQPQALLQYIDFLMEYDLGFYVDDPKRFPRLALQYYYPGLIQNAIVLSDLEAYDLGHALQQLPGQGCRFISLFIDLKEETTLAQLSKALSEIADSIVLSIQVYITHHPDLKETDLRTLFTTFKKVAGIHICGAAEQVTKAGDPIIYNSKKLADFITPNGQQLILNIPFFSEAVRFNPYYYQKVVIDWQGQIKNGVQHPTSFGNITETDLGSIVQSQAFQALWEVNADHITTLKNNELRYARFIDPALALTGEQSISIQQVALS